MSLCLISRFKNERHILYEFINHYLEEGVDCLILIDDNSDDNYLELNKEWLDVLIKSEKVIIRQAKKRQYKEYDLHMKTIRKFDWLIVCDMDEFFFSVPQNSTLKSLLNTRLSIFDYINIPWKIFTHDCYYHPKSVINDNLYTHNEHHDPTSPHTKGYKSIIKTKSIKSINIHFCIAHENTNLLFIKDCHNKLIQNNHYRTQSEEYLRGVKERRGGGVRKNKYRKFDLHKQDIYSTKCQLLMNKRKNLIEECLTRDQVKPQIYNESSFFLENLE